jgi:hypothetical protein
MTLSEIGAFAPFIRVSGQRAFLAVPATGGGTILVEFIQDGIRQSVYH